jgi:hypothetical protein
MHIGDTRVLVTSGTAFEGQPSPKLISVTITEIHNDRPDRHDPEKTTGCQGYVAVGDDGNTYHCQYPDFDTWSTDPYANWERAGFDPTEHTEIVKDFLLWDVERVIYYREVEILEALATQYPGTLTKCNETYTNGHPHGYYYVADGCVSCGVMARLPAKGADNEG